VGRFFVTIPAKALLTGCVWTRGRLLFGLLHSRICFVIVPLGGERRIRSPKHQGAGYCKRDGAHGGLSSFVLMSGQVSQRKRASIVYALPNPTGTNMQRMNIS
jgi:hypothetical protein